MRRAALVAGCLAGMVLSLETADPSVWDGVYTAEQTRRGETAYLQTCASCHGTALEGGDMTPPLVGGAFTSNWNDLTVGDLFDRIRTTMPLDNPGRLSRTQTAGKIRLRERRGSMGTQDDTLDDFIDAAAAALGLPVEPEWKPGIKANLQVTLRVAAMVAEFELPDEAEPAPVFEA